MKVLRSLFFLLLLVITGLSLFAQPVNNGMRLMQMGQTGKAKDAFIQELKTNNSSELWFNLGMIYLNNGNTDSANTCFAQAYVAESKSNFGFVGQALIKIRSGSSAEAIQLLDRIQKSSANAKDARVLIAIAAARYEAGDTAKWIEPLTAISFFDRKNSSAYIKAGDIYSSLAEKFPNSNYYGIASGRYEQALYYDPVNVEAMTKLAGIYFISRSYFEASNKLSKALELDSTYLPALKILGQVEYTLGKYDLASQHFGRYMALVENTLKVYPNDRIQYINILYFNKEYAKANEFIEAALKTDPSNEVLLRLKGYTSYELNKNDEGLPAMIKFFTLRSVTDTNKIIPTDYEYYGKLLSRHGDDSLAVINLTKAVEMDPSNAGLYEDIAKSYEKMKKYKLAIDSYDKLILTSKNISSATWFSKGRDLYFVANEIAKTADSLQRPAYIKLADSAFGMVCELSPNSHLGFLWRARMSADLDPETSQGLAKPYYEKAISMMEAKNDPEKYKKDLMEGYRYMGYYNYLKYDAAKKAKDTAAVEQSRAESMSYWQKILAIDPTDKIALEGIKGLKK